MSFTIYETYLMKTENQIFLRTPETLSVAILILPDSNTLSLAATVDPLRAANRRAANPLYHWQFVSFDGGATHLTSGISVETSVLEQAATADALIVVAGFNLEKHASQSRMRRLRHERRKYQAVGGVDGGSWILARAGLLDGVTATTHWEDIETFMTRFPEIDTVRDRYVIDGRYFTTGGASPCLDMMLHLIRCRQGPELALRVASAFIYDPLHPASAPQSLVSSARLEITAPAVAAAVRRMETDIEDPPTITAIALGIGLSARSLETAFRQTLGTTPGQFFLDLRLQEAHRLVQDSDLTLQEIAIRTGFAAQATFARAFRRKFGKTASVLRQRPPSLS
jgi:transcriptional regulator GlxA family with amidase domain